MLIIISREKNLVSQNFVITRSESEVVQSGGVLHLLAYFEAQVSLGIDRVFEKKIYFPKEPLCFQKNYGFSYLIVSDHM